MNNLIAQFSAAQNGTRYTLEEVRELIAMHGGSIILDAKDWGHDHAILFDTQVWTGPDDARDEGHGFCAMFWTMDGQIAFFVGPSDLQSIHAQWAKWTLSEII